MDESSPHFIATRRGAYLPHWTRAHAIYSVTFRLADALPVEILEQIQHEREDIVHTAHAAGRPLSPYEEGRLATLQSARIQKYLDAGHGECWMKHDVIASIVANALCHFDRNRYNLFAWCVMPNHVHTVVQPLPGWTLPQVVASWKSYTATMANRTLAREGTFWQPEYYDRIVRNESELERSIEYVLDNPKNAGLPDWAWSGSRHVPNEVKARAFP